MKRINCKKILRYAKLFKSVIKSEYRIIILAFILGIVFWSIDVLIDNMFFYKNIIGTDKGYRFFLHNIFMRLIIALFFILFGILSAFLVYRRKRAEKQMMRIAKILTISKNISQLLTNISVEKELISEICKTFNKHEDIHKSMFVILDRDNKVVSTFISNNGDEITQFIDGSPLVLPDCVNTTMEEELKVIKSPKNEQCKICFFREKRKNSFCIFLKIKHTTRVYGMLGLSVSDKNFLSTETTNLLLEIASNIGSILFNFQMQKIKQENENLLKKSESKFKSLAENSPNMIFINSLDKIIYVNRICCEVTGYSREEFYSLDFDFFNLIAPEDHEILKTNYNKLLKGKDIKPFENTLITKSGKKIPVLISMKIIDYEGKRAILGNITDITLQKRFEEVIDKIYSLPFDADQTLFFQSIVKYLNEILEVDYSFIGICDDSSQQIITLAFAQKNRILSNISYELIFTPCAGIIDGSKDVQIIVDNVLNHFPKDHLLQELQIRGYIGVPLTDSRKNVIGNLVVLKKEKIDNAAFCVHVMKGFSVRIASVLEHIKAYHEIQSSREKYQILLENTNSLIYQVSQDYRIEYINSRWIERLGYDPREKGELCYQAIAKRDTPCVDCKNELVFSGENLRFEKKLPSGEIFDVYNTRIQHADGSFSKISISHDITQLKDLQERLTKSRDYYRAIMRNLHEDIIILDTNYRITDINCEKESTSNIYSRKDIGKFCFAVSHGYDKPCNEFGEDCKLQEVIRTGKNQSCRHIHKRRDGSEMYVDILLSPIKDTNGRVVKIIESIRDITDLVNLQRSIQESEKKYREMVEGSPVCVIIHSNGKIVFANQKAAELLGVEKAQDLIGVAIKDIIHPDYYKKINERLSQLYEKKKALPSFEVKLITFDHRVLYMEIVETPINFEGKAASQLVGIDISERKKAQEEISRLYQAVENSDEIVFITDREGTFTYVNPKFTEIYGWQKEEIIGKKTPRILKSGLYPKSFYEKFWQDLLTKHNVKGEYKNKDKAGNLIDVHSSASVITDNNGRIVGFLAVQSDISEQIKMYHALQESEEKYRNLIEQSADAIYILYEGKFEVMNARFREMFGLSYEDVMKPEFNFLQVVAPESREMVKERMRLVSSGKEVPLQYEFKAIGKDGRKIDIEASVSYIKYKNGIATQGILRDITERKKLERQLQLAQKMEAIGTLTSGIAHDFNNILTAIIGNAELALIHYKDGSGVEDELRGILESSSRAAKLIRQLMAFSRQQLINPVVMDINSHISEISKMLLRLISEDIKFEINLGKDVPPIKADPGQIEQILFNLVINARDAIIENTNPNAERKIIIETSYSYLDQSFVSTHPGSHKGEHVIITVSDTGIGMTEDVKNKIFEPFFTTKEVGKGTGLGLSTVYGIVKQNNAYITLYSERGKGSTFKIYWPAIKNRIQTKREFKSELSSYSGTETILIVEDNENVRKFAKKSLERLGYKIIDVSNGLKALDVIKNLSTKIDLIFTDMIMPEMNGNELAVEALKIRPDIKIIFASGYSDDKTRVSIPMVKEEIIFITKPYTILELAKNVRKALDKK